MIRSILLEQGDAMSLDEHIDAWSQLWKMWGLAIP